jgi:hypothetical protein
MKSYIGIIASLILFLFSLLEIYNFSALYKDQVEFKAVMAKNVSAEYCLNLIDERTKLTSIIDFFITCAIFSFLTFIYLMYKKYKNHEKLPL